ncbi:polysaccharide pyruvyl transferase family protein [Vibrio crassostreae]|uniref:polysaccharide pyruvyl transferase family protein n=1 Tax=Vibrio crassostreae TaxID=246167 RepID=UPI001B3056B5|nr:polysaccharide pyruvyl transferase family protein [Vibrio crassostreae]
MKNKIGIVSTQFTINYGAVLQAYSLYKLVDKINNGNVEIIDYCPEGDRYGHVENYSFSSFKSTIVSLATLFNINYKHGRKNKKLGFSKFVSDEFVMTKSKYKTNEELKNANFDYNVCITGSDQVWNPRVINDDSFYLNFLKSNVRKVSYAASIGDELDGEGLKILSQHIKDFHEVSLREPIQVEEIKELIEKDVAVNIDPVFLTSRHDWIELSKKSTLSKDNLGDYILVYEVNSPSNFKKYVESLKSKYSCKVIEVSTRPIPKYRGVENIPNASPYDFLYLISNAKFVMTSSFHGVAFSCLLNIPFSTALGNTRSGRQVNILNMFGLEHCIISNEKELYNNYDSNFDWTYVNECIENLNNESNNYLTRAINND